MVWKETQRILVRPLWLCPVVKTGNIIVKKTGYKYSKILAEFKYVGGRFAQIMTKPTEVGIRGVFTSVHVTCSCLVFGKAKL
jgi:hypothetical protein